MLNILQDVRKSKKLKPSIHYHRRIFIGGLNVLYFIRKDSLGCRNCFILSGAEESPHCSQQEVTREIFHEHRNCFDK